MDLAIQLLMNSAVSGAGYGLVAVSFALIYSTTRFFHFAHGAVYAAAAYIAYFVVSGQHASNWLAICVAAGGAAVLGAIMECAVYRPLRFRRASPTVMMLAALGMLIVLQNGISLVFGDEMRTLHSAQIVDSLTILGARITPTQVNIVIGCVGTAIGLTLWLRETRMGMILRAVASNPEVATVVGINSSAIILLAVVMGSSLAGIASVLVAYDTGIRPMMGFQALLMGVVGMVVGGIGSIPGAFLGGLLVGLAQQVGAWILPSKWQDAVVFLILIAFLLFRPQGFLGKRLRSANV